MPSLYDPRRHVRVLAERVSDVSSTDFPGDYPDEDHSWDLENFKKGNCFRLRYNDYPSVRLNLTWWALMHDASIANMFRRIVIAEVPTVCVERVYVWNNTSVIVDEVLSHRLGLVPLNVDPALVELIQGPESQATDRNTIVFRLQLVCSRNKKAPKDATRPDQLYINHELRSSHMKWEPRGEQSEVYAHNPPAPTNSGGGQSRF